MKKLLADEKLVFTLGKLVFTAATFIFTLVAAKLLGPEKMGSWNNIALIFTYGMFAQMGVLNGLGQKIPLLLAKKNMEQIEYTMTQTFWYLVFIGTIMLIFGIYFLTKDNSYKVVGLGVLVLMFSLFYNYAFIVIRSFQGFYFLGLAHFIMALSILISLAFFYYYPSLVNFALSFIIWMFVGFLFLKPYSKFIRFNWDGFSQLYPLIRTGLPIFLVGFVYTMFNSIDRIIIINFLDLVYLGLYTPAITATGIILIAPSIVSTIAYPKLVHLYGKSESIESLMDLVKKTVIINFIATVIVCFVTYFLYKYIFFPYFLPEYTDGKLAMNIILFASIFLPIGLSFGDFLNTIGLQKRYLRNIIFGLVINIFIGYILVIYFGMALTGVALGTLSGYFFFTMLQLYTFWEIKNDPKYA